MPKDNREVLQGIRLAANDRNTRRDVLTEADDIAVRFSQSELDSFVEHGVLSGDWKSAKGKGSQAETKTNESTAAFPEDFPGYDVLGQVEGMTPEKVSAMSDDELLEIKGIGEKTLKQIREYGK